MKNIYVLPTDKDKLDFPFIAKNCFNNNYTIVDSTFKDNCELAGMNIYITSDEEIKDATWVIQKSTGKFMFLAFTRSDSYNKNKDLKEEFSKIILTDNQDLVKDGVQAIPDDFLEWFVNNSNCEEVVFSTYHVKGDISGKLHYKIIIPKEEHIWDISTCKYFDKEVGCEKDTCICSCTDECLEYLTKTCKKLSETKQEELKYPIGGYAPGYYMCNCSTCKKQFQGDKRAVQCEPCAILTTTDDSQNETVSKKDSLLRYIDDLCTNDTLSWETSYAKNIAIESVFSNAAKSYWFNQFTLKNGKEDTLYR